MTSEIKERYEALRKKLDLPEFGELEEFQVASIEEKEFLLSGIRENITCRIQDSIDFLSDMFQPDASITNMYESRVFEEEGKKVAFDAFRRLMFWKRASLKASIINDDRANAEFVKGFVGEWKILKNTLVGIVEKVKNSWESELEQNEKLGYFG